MSEYSMPVLSEQEREIDIKACIEALSVLEKNLKTWGCVWEGYIESQIRRQKIALAALTAKPEYFYRIRSDGGREGPLHESETENVRKKSWMPLYTTPPVPVKQEGEQ